MNKPETRYLVISVRKSDQKMFIPDSREQKNGIDTLADAMDIAQAKAQNNSEDYWYVVFKCDPVVAFERDNPPTKVTYFS